MALDPAALAVAPGDEHEPGSAAWWERHRERAARRRPRPDGLTLERIVDAAIALVDAEGLAALTVRRLAEDLGTGSASLYRHVASRDELVVLMVDRVIGEVDLPDGSLPARRRVEVLAHELRRVLLAHAALLPALSAAPLLGPNALRGVEVGLEAVIDAGHELDVAVLAVLALIDFVLGRGPPGGATMGTPRFELGDPRFWQRSLEERMADFAVLREQGPFVKAASDNPLTGTPDEFWAVTRYDEVVEISRRPKDFCSGKGSISIADMPAEAMEFFGSFITMDDPRHARQRGIVARSFTPRALAGVLDSVETICTEVIDAMCEQGEVDLVEAISQPFPLLVICDMMGIPRSEFDTVLDATNVILGAGDPEMTGGDDVLTALFQAGMTLTELMNELAEERRKDPKDDLTSALVHNELGEDMLAPDEIAPFFILLAVAGNDTTRTATSIGMHLLSQHPDQRRIWQDDPDGVTQTAVEEIVRMASPVTFMRRTVTRPLTLSGHDFDEGDKLVLFYGAANRDPREFDDPERFDVRRDPNPHVGFGGPGPHFCLGAHLARRELSVVFRQLFTRLPDIEVVGEPTYLEAAGIPLVGGIKRLPVRFTPTAPVGAG